MLDIQFRYDRMLKLANITELNDALAAIIPSGVSTSADVVCGEESVEFIDELKHLEKASLTRRNEFIVGRRCARAALKSIGSPAVELPADADGIPRWPAGTLGSISHSRGLCCAVAAMNADLIGLGIDLEKTTRISPAAMKHVVHPAEHDYAEEDQPKGSLLFSAKEAFFKMQFPNWHAQPNFKDLALTIDTVNQEMSVQHIAMFLPEALTTAAEQIKFRYRFFGDYVITICWLDR